MSLSSLIPLRARRGEARRRRPLPEDEYAEQGQEA